MKRVAKLVGFTLSFTGFCLCMADFFGAFGAGPHDIGLIGVACFILGRILFGGPDATEQRYSVFLRN